MTRLTTAWIIGVTISYSSSGGDDDAYISLGISKHVHAKKSWERKVKLISTSLSQAVQQRQIVFARAYACANKAAAAKNCINNKLIVIMSIFFLCFSSHPQVLTCTT